MIVETKLHTSMVCSTEQARCLRDQVRRVHHPRTELDSITEKKVAVGGCLKMICLNEPSCFEIELG